MSQMQYLDILEECGNKKSDTMSCKHSTIEDMGKIARIHTDWMIMQT